jgi:hypothetical protein
MVDFITRIFSNLIHEVRMNHTDIVLAGVIAILLIATLTGIRLGLLSARVGGIIMLVSPTILNAIIVLWSGGDIVDLVCMGLLLSFAFGPVTFIAGRTLEKIAKGGNINQS